MVLREKQDLDERGLRLAAAYWLKPLAGVKYALSQPKDW
jgi:hypothetical protein